MTRINLDWWKLPQTRAEARDISKPRYFTGQPCAQGHIAPRRTKNYECCRCHALAKMRREKLNPQIKRRENQRRMPKIIATFQRWCERNPERRKAFLRSYMPEYRMKQRAREIEQLEALSARLRAQIR